MSVQLAMLVATAVLAVVAVAAAVVAVRALRQAKALADREPASVGEPVSTVLEPVLVTEPKGEGEREPELEVVRVVEGRVIVQPTHDQVVSASMTRPAVRLNIVAAGVAHALRPESRDRILGLMRREYRARKRARQRAARAAARATNGPPPPPGGRGWVGS
ncbi:hypothetical protein IDH50_14610 [Aeromicrobium tamlense]|uniref:Uncharacterized protein n=1 Tax=Aeromicrobium tamlense TaxID=375541 RepID=A0A8I0KJ32_9ACTN|nr:hypothetical protein [Aeromicrobium tamlense]MBD1270393.1 hypothetical protein [Aeromicrobium tamlense]MBD1271475.1 hypothetical protein [Aeromicrobium tamlense]NYI37780.1 hypothetical protein [Aeromicrobium tamlense]